MADGQADDGNDGGIAGSTFPLGAGFTAFLRESRWLGWGTAASPAQTEPAARDSVDVSTPWHYFTEQLSVAGDWLTEKLRYSVVPAIGIAITDGLCVLYGVVKVPAYLTTGNRTAYLARLHTILTRPVHLGWIIPMAVLIITLSVVAHCVERLELQMEKCPVPGEPLSASQQLRAYWSPVRRALKTFKNLLKTIRNVVLVAAFLTDMAIDLLRWVPLVLSASFVSLGLVSGLWHIQLGVERKPLEKWFEDAEKTLGFIAERRYLVEQQRLLSELNKRVLHISSSDLQAKAHLQDISEELKVTLLGLNERLEALTPITNNVIDTIRKARDTKEDALALFINSHSLHFAACVKGFFEGCYRSLWPLVLLTPSSALLPVIGPIMLVFIIASVVAAHREEQQQQDAARLAKHKLRLALCERKLFELKGNVDIAEERKLLAERKKCIKDIRKLAKPGLESAFHKGLSEGLLFYGMLSSLYFAINIFFPLAGLSCALVLLIIPLITSICFTCQRMYAHWQDLDEQQRSLEKQLTARLTRQFGSCSGPSTKTQFSGGLDTVRSTGTGPYKAKNLTDFFTGRPPHTPHTPHTPSLILTLSVSLLQCLGAYQEARPPKPRWDVAIPGPDKLADLCQRANDYLGKYSSHQYGASAANPSPG